MSRRTLALVPLLWLFGCGKDDGEALPALEVSPPGLAFGRVPVGATSSLEFVVENVGGGATEVLSIALTEGDGDVWTIDGAAAPLEPGAYLVVTVTFAPGEERQEYGRVTLRTDGDDVVVQLSGVGGAFEGDGDGDGVVAADDCDDHDDTVYPGAPEICDGQDNDCDGTPGDEEVDADADGHLVCAGDCDDTDAAVGPGDDHPETCDGRDEDCDGLIDDLDADADGHSPCAFAGDCDDADPLAYPIFVDASSASASPAGTDADPFATVAEAIAARDAVCREIVLAPGSYEIAGHLSFTTLAIRGAGAEATTLVPAAGGPGLTLSEGTFSLSDLAVEGGSAPDDGGAIYVVDSALATSGVRFEGNAAAGDGGAIYAERAVLALTGSTFVGNTAGDRGGAVFLSGAPSAPFEVARNVFQGNEAAAGGGAIYLLDAAQEGSWVRNNRFQGDVGGAGSGGVHVAGERAALTIANNTFAGERSDSEGGCAQLSATDGSALAFASNVMVACGGLAGLYVDLDSNSGVTYNTVYGSLSGLDFSGGVAEGVDGQEAGDPLLIAFTDDGDPSDDDLAPSPGSPLLDSGVPEADWNDADGTRNDRGFTGGPAAP